MITNTLDFRRLYIFALVSGAAENENIQATDSPNLSPEMKTYYDLRLIKKAGPNLVYAQFAGKTPLPKNKGKSVEFRGFKSLDTSVEKSRLTEGKTPDGQTLEAYSITADLVQYGNYVKLTDFVQLTAIDRLLNESVDKLAEQASIVIDKIIRNAILGDEEVGVSFAGNVETEEELTVKGHTLTVADIRRIVNQLKRVNAPKIDGMYPLIVHPDNVLDLTATEEYKDMHKYAKPDNLFNGYVGDVVGARIYESTNVKITKNKTTGVAIYWCTLIGKDSYDSVSLDGGGLETIIKPLGSAGSADPLNQRGTAGWKSTNATAIKIPEYLINFGCTSSENAVADAEEESGAVA